MSSEAEVIYLGSFPQGAKPPALSYQFLDGDGDPINMSTGTWTGQIKGEQLHVDPPQPTIFTATPTVDSGTATITYIWPVEDMSIVGRFRLILWAGNTITRVGSPVFEYHVTDAPGAVPTV